MKKCILSVFIIAMCCLLILPMTVSAGNYTVSGTDLTIKIDDDYWCVFTRDNLKNNPELDELGVSYNDVYTNMMNNKIYIDAILYYESGSYIELFVRKTNIDKIVNLSNYDDDKVLELAEKLADKYNAREYSVYKSKYKFMKLEYTDLGFYICEYVTVVNGENYTFTFQSSDAYTNSKYNEIETIVDSARFNIDTSLKESGDSSLWADLFEQFIIGALVACAVGGISLLINKKKKIRTTDNCTYAAGQRNPTLDVGNTFFCAKCGEKLIASSSFCTKCGTKIETVSNAPQPLSLIDVESAVSIYLNQRVSVSDISCTLVYVIPASTGAPKEMHLSMTVGEENFSSLDLIFFDKNRKSYYLHGNRLTLDDSWQPKDNIFSFDISLFKSFNTEVDRDD